MLHTGKDKRKLLSGTFGIEIEKLRVTGDGHMAQTEHPFQDDPHIVRDYSENQIEINSEPWPSPEEALKEIGEHLARIKEEIGSYPEKEYLWPFSNPPYIKNEEDIPVAQYFGEKKASTEYREYLGRKYGRYLMTYSGIHVNYSFNEELLTENYRLARSSEEAAAFDYRTFKDKVYLDLAERAAEYGWLLVALMSASPVMDASFYDYGRKGESCFSGMASQRCGEEGYWNKFVPLFDYSSADGYARSIERYVENGELIAPRELYYPVRVKPAGEYSMEALRNNGISHLELRMYDLNPFNEVGLDLRDVKFAELFLLWLAFMDDERLNEKEQKAAVKNFKNAAKYDLDKSSIFFKGKERPVREAGNELLEEMENFYSEYTGGVKELIAFQKEKLNDETKRYACRVKEKYAEDFVEKAMEELRRG